jgi:hypothetical protein
MQRDQQRVVRGAEPDEQGTQWRLGGQVEPVAGVLAERSLGGLGQVPERDLGLVGDDLDELVVPVDEPRPQHLVPGRDPRERAAQRRRVEIAADPQADTGVVHRYRR